MRSWAETCALFVTNNLPTESYNMLSTQFLTTRDDATITKLIAHYSAAVNAADDPNLFKHYQQTMVDLVRERRAREIDRARRVPPAVPEKIHGPQLAKYLKVHRATTDHKVGYKWDAYTALREELESYPQLQHTAEVRGVYVLVEITAILEKVV